MPGPSVPVWRAKRPRVGGGPSPPGPLTVPLHHRYRHRETGCEDSADDSGKTCYAGGRLPMNSLLRLKRVRVAYCPDGSRAGPSGLCVSCSARRDAAGRGADGVVACELPCLADEPGLDDPDLPVDVDDGHIDTPPQQGSGLGGKPELIKAGQLGAVPDQQLPIGGLSGRT